VGTRWVIVAALVALLAAGCSRQEAGWRDAAGADSIAAYEDYLARFPAGAHAAAAQARILELREEQDWARAGRLRTPEAWQRYLAEWPAGRHAEEARALLNQYVPVEARSGAWSVQLGAFSGEAAAQAARARLTEARAAALADLPLLVLAPQDDPGGLWRLRTGPLGEGAARDLCARLRAQGVDCVPVAE
jgi:hypothetical protein